MVRATSLSTRLGVLLLVAAVLATACASVADPGSNTVEANGATSSDEGVAAVPDGANGLVVDLRGSVEGSMICPGGTQPCVVLDQELDIQDLGVQGAALVRVEFADGTATVLHSEAIESPLSNFTDHCENTLPEADFDRLAELPQADQEAAEEDGTYAYDLLAQYQLTVPDAFATRWVSGSRRVHFGVVGDGEPHREALAELGIGEAVCVVDGFAASEATLAEVQEELGDLLVGFASSDDGFGWSADAFAGAVVADLHRVDESMIEQARERFGDLVVLRGSWTVLNGSLEELDAALDELAEETGSTQAGLSATCGAVRFSSVPPDLGEFPSLDSEIQTVFDDFMTGPLSVETDFLEGYEWTVAVDTADQLVLFGQRATNPGDFVNARFENRGGIWQATGWGGCSIDVSAPGFGSATTILDPDHEPDPESTELHLLIMERACANGEAPVGRDVLPVVNETETTVEISTLVAPVPGGANCPGNPWHPVVAELSAPLGSRQVIDTQTSPGIERSWPPTAQDLDG